MPGMKTIDQFPRPVREIENQWIELADGARLAARIWLPADALSRGAGDPRIPPLSQARRHGRARRSSPIPISPATAMPAVRVDMRGTGDSDGVMLDEYAKQEQDDALAVIAWLAAQPWCTGSVGMIGISWGGFNGLQVAARRPPALKAIITLCSTDDRYADDIHYKGGCLLNENLGWAATMFAYSSRPPDPVLVGERWRAMWLERLAARALPGRRLAAPSAPRRLLEARLGVRGFRRHRGGGLCRRRLERCLFQCRAAPARRPAQPRARRSSAPGRTNIRISPCPDRRSASSRRRCAGGTSG